MNPKVQYVDFEKALDDKALKTFQIIYVGLTVGILSFTAMVLFMSVAVNPSPLRSGSDSTKLLSILTCINLLVNFSVFAITPKIFQKLLWKGEAIDAVRCLQLIRQALIVRLAILEAASFVGLVITLLCVLWDAVRIHPQYWINLLPVLSFLAFATKTFPTRDKIEGIFTQYFLQ